MRVRGYRIGPVRCPVVDDSPEIYENMAKALAVLTAWNESGDGDLSLVDETTAGYLNTHADRARVRHPSAAARRR